MEILNSPLSSKQFLDVYRYKLDLLRAHSCERRKIPIDYLVVKSQYRMAVSDLDEYSIYYISSYD